MPGHVAKQRLEPRHAPDRVGLQQQAHRHADPGNFRRDRFRLEQGAKDEGAALGRLYAVESDLAGSEESQVTARVRTPLEQCTVK